MTLSAFGSMSLRTMSSMYSRGVMSVLLALLYIMLKLFEAAWM
jgi:hypothetical protein